MSTTPSLSASPTSTPDVGADLRILSENALRGSLIELGDLPPGFVADRADASSTNKTFCDYTPPVVERVKVSSNFTDDADHRYVSSTLRQFAGESQARRAFDKMVEVLQTCRKDEQNGTSLRYSLMSVPDLGDGSVGVQIEGGGYAIKQNFVLVGPTLISVGAVGVGAGEIVSLLKAQVNQYKAAAG